MNFVYPKVGISFAIEVIHDGALIFFGTREDFEKFHNTTSLLPKVVQSEQGEPILMRGEILKAPADFLLESYLPLLKDAYHFLSDDIDVSLVSESAVQIYYKSGLIYEKALKQIGDLIPKLIQT